MSVGSASSEPCALVLVDFSPTARANQAGKPHLLRTTLKSAQQAAVLSSSFTLTPQQVQIICRPGAAQSEVSIFDLSLLNLALYETSVWQLELLEPPKQYSMYLLDRENKQRIIGVQSGNPTKEVSSALVASTKEILVKARVLQKGGAAVLQWLSPRPICTPEPAKSTLKRKLEAYPDEALKGFDFYQAKRSSVQAIPTAHTALPAEAALSQAKMGGSSTSSSAINHLLSKAMSTPLQLDWHRAVLERLSRFVPLIPDNVAATPSVPRHLHSAPSGDIAQSLNVGSPYCTNAVPTAIPDSNTRGIFPASVVTSMPHDARQQVLHEVVARPSKSSRPHQVPASNEDCAHYEVPSVLVADKPRLHANYLELVQSPVLAAPVLEAACMPEWDCGTPEPGGQRDHGTDPTFADYLTDRDHDSSHDFEHFYLTDACRSESNGSLASAEFM